MTLKTLSAALLATTLIGSAAQADITIIQSGPMPGASAFAPQMNAQGANAAMALIQNMVDSRMPSMSGTVAAAIAGAGELPAPAAAPAPGTVSFTGHWDLIELFNAHTGTLGFSAEMLSGAHVEIVEEGLFSGNAGCNTIFGHFEQDGGMIQSGEVMATRMLCDEPTMRMERALIESLSNAALFAHGHDRLVFLDAEGHPLARFAAEIPATVAPTEAPGGAPIQAPTIDD